MNDRESRSKLHDMGKQLKINFRNDHDFFFLDGLEVGQVFLVIFYAVCDRAAQNNERVSKRRNKEKIKWFH